MESSTTLLFNPNNVHEPPKKFTFDYSYWSHDGFIESSDGFCERDPSHPNGNKYADQVCDSQIMNLVNDSDLLNDSDLFNNGDLLNSDLLKLI